MNHMDGSIRAYGFLDAITRPGKGASDLGRINVLVDAVRAEAVESRVAENRAPADLFVVRVMSTLNRLQALYPLVNWSQEGAWVELVLENSPGEPPVWLISAVDDYGGPIRRANLIQAKPLSSGPPGGGSTKIMSDLVELCRPKGVTYMQTSPRGLGQRSVASGPFVRVVDVGHASFSAIHFARNLGSEIQGYFDVGGPVFFHHRTFPKTFVEASCVPKRGFVALSHWDYDHYSLAVSKLPALMKLDWYAPDQSVGPNAAALQAKLDKRLTLLSAPSYPIAANLKLWKCSGPSNDRNGSGYVLHVARKGGDVLLTGDVPYDMVPASAQMNLGGLSITHHGGAGSGSPPHPHIPNSVAAVSYGIPNRYHHPDSSSIAQHKAAGWTVCPTYVSKTSRGDVWL